MPKCCDGSTTGPEFVCKTSPHSKADLSPHQQVFVFNANCWAHWLALSEAQVARNASTVRTALMLPEGKHPRKQGAKDRPRLPE